jgi:hypothetical protein
MTHEQAVARQAVERYLLDEMPEIERFAFEEHYFDCTLCAEDVRNSALMREGVATGLLPEKVEGARDKAEGSLSAVALAKAERQKAEGRGPEAEDAATDWRKVLPWAAAAMLAVAAGYQSLWVVPALRDQVVTPGVVAPVTLRGATRGSEPTIARPTEKVVALAVDLAGVAAGARLTYDLRAADQTSVASGTAVAPPPGTPLLLLMPASALQTTGRYVLTVGTGEAPGSASVHFQFSVTEP